MEKLKIGLIGCGTIGTEIALACQGGLKDKVELFAICDSDDKKVSALDDILNKKTTVLKLDEIIERSGFVVEAASAKISAEVVRKCIADGKGCMVMSVGGLVGQEALLASARSKGVNVYIPSGALCGVDGLKSASAGRIDSVTLTTRKPPKGLEGAPYIKTNNIDLSGINKETVIFEGSAEEAIKGFPQNINVAAVLSLAGIGAKKTRVRIVTSPDYRNNTHEVEIRGEAGTIFTKTENVPSKTNPKTSALAFFSAIATLEAITDSVRIGT